MGRGKRKEGRGAVPLTVDETSSKLGAPVTLVEDPATRYADEGIRELRRSLEERVADFVSAGQSLSDACDGNDEPFGYFVSEVVQEDGFGLPSELNYTIQDADSLSWDCRLVVVADYSAAVGRPTPAMIVDADLADYVGPAGAIRLAEEIYDACDVMLKARAEWLPEQSAATPSSPVGGQLS